MNNLPAPDTAQPGFFDVLRARRSVRAFEPRTVEEGKVQQILAAANSAPSAGNLQAYEIVVVRDNARKQALVEACYNHAFIPQAPVVLIFCANPKRCAAKYGESGGEFFSLQDATIACAYAELAINALGLATVWIGAIKVPAVQKIIGVSTEWKPVALLPIGYRAENPPPTQRRELAELVHEVR